MVKNSLFKGILFGLLITNFVFISAPVWADNTPDDPDLAAIQQQEAQMKANFQKLNQSNPLFNSSGPSAPIADANVGGIKPDAAFENLNKMMKNPLVQGYMKVFSNPELISQFQVIIKHPDRQLILFAEAAWFILFLIYRAWLATKAIHWFFAFLIRLMSNAGYFVISSIGIPMILIGDPYIKVLTTLYQSLTGMIK